MHTTSRLGLQIPDSGDAESAFPADSAQELGVLDNAVLCFQGTLVAMPAATAHPQGSYYYTTDTHVLYRNWSGAWIGDPDVVPSGRASGSAQATPLGNYSTVLGAGGATYGTATFLNGGLTYSTTTGLFTVPVAGVYSVNGFANLILNGSSQTAAAYWQLSIEHNGSIDEGPAEGVPTTATAPYAGMSIEDQYSCAAGDTLGLVAGGLGMSNTVAINNYVSNVCRVG
jgi:hypothetical protein